MLSISIVTSHVIPEKVQLYERTFRALREQVLANEPGISLYELCRVSGEPHTYKVIEACDSPQTQKAHLATDYYQAAIRIIVECLEGGSYDHVICEAVG